MFKHILMGNGNEVIQSTIFTIIDTITIICLKSNLILTTTAPAQQQIKSNLFKLNTCRLKISKNRLPE